MQHVRELPQPQKLSDRAAPEITWERFGAIAKELPSLFTRHWREIALNQDAVPLAPDWDRYYTLDIQGILRIVTVRFEGELVGYVFLMFTPHLHYATTLYVIGDIFWLDPLYRQGWTGVHLFKEVIRGSREMGGQLLHLGIKNHFKDGRVGRLLERLGLKPIETIYGMEL